MGEGIDSVLMHDRAREANSELRRALIALSTGSIAVLFLAVTAEINPPLNLAEKICAAGTILTHTSSALFGLFAWRCDALRNYSWAREIETNNDSDGVEQNKALRKVHQKRMHVSDAASRWLFSLGVCMAAVYLVQRTV